MQTDRPYIELRDDGRAWFEDVLQNNYEEALARANSLLDEATVDENGCYVTQTVGPQKFRFLGRQERVYRFIFCLFNHYAANSAEVIRHRCNNRRCINPDHMQLGDRRENHWDDVGFRANGVDYGLL
ncbi:HNH endonuclease [Tropicimonas sp. IMCC6043]|uniref:HNH endonuclease n=1 Tax=Tropicimonas sp. IMCC6043 TaxID=2510645 RepID=UPI00101CD38A|nr:HNH endonuclease [Tropicimonas sp. IMCC6043]RYH08576.1 hypothetical protein EU800_16170 [Tropicimonas sp. IMCC6043]